MLFRNRLRASALVFAGAMGLSGLGVAAAGAAQAVTWDCGSEVHASWGGGQFCDGSNGNWKVRVRDEASDGYCVHVKYYSYDAFGYKTVANTTECNGVWKTIEVGGLPHDGGVRLYRADGRYLTLPQ